MAWDDPGHLRDISQVQAFIESPPLTGRQLVTTWIDRSSSIGIVSCTSIEARETSGPPFVASRFTFEVQRTLRGSPPRTMERDGGSLPDRDVINSEAAYISVGVTYLAFFAESNRGPVVIGSAPVEAGNRVHVLGEDIAIDEVSTLIATHGGSAQ